MFYYGGESDESRFQTSTAFLETYFANSKAPDLILHKGKFNSLTRSEGLVAYPNFESYGITAYDKKEITSMEVNMILHRICWFIRISEITSVHR